MANDPEIDIPDISQVDFDDRLRVLMGVPPKEGEVIVYEDDEEASEGD